MLNNQKKIEKTSVILAISIILFSFMLMPLVSADLFSSSKDLKVNIDETSQLFFLGDISFFGSFLGMDLNLSLDAYAEYLSLIDEYISDSSDLQEFLTIDDVYGIPVFSESTLEQSTVFIVNTTLFSIVDELNPPELLDQLDHYFISVEHASITVTEGVAILGSDVQEFQVHHDGSYGFGGFFQLPFNEFPANGLGIISDQETIITVPSQTSLFYPFNAKIEIISTDDTRYTITDQNTIILVKSIDTTEVIQESLIHYFPLPDERVNDAEVTISVTETDLSNANPTMLIQSVTNQVSDFSDINTEHIFSFDQEQSVITLFSNLFNSGLILLNVTQPVEIDDNTFESAELLAGRGPEYVITVDQQKTLPIAIEGSSSLIFLNDHIHTETAKNSENGVILPLFSIILWIGAVMSILFYFHLKQNHQLIESTRDEPEILRKKGIRILSYTLTFLIFFILVDLEFSFQFGISFFSSMNTSINGFFVIILLLVQFLILAFIGFLYALPSLIIHNNVFKTLVKNKYNFLTRFLLLFPIFWLGLQIYFLVILNIFLSFVPWSSIMGLG